MNVLFANNTKGVLPCVILTIVIDAKGHKESLGRRGIDIDRLPHKVTQQLRSEQELFIVLASLTYKNGV